MNVTLFNKNYWVRRFGEQREVQGYLVSGHTDMVVSLNVHPLGSDQLQALPEGERSVKRLEAQSSTELFAANEATGQKGDLLLYHGRWYECVAAQLWDHTILSHWNCQFVLVPDDGTTNGDTDSPPSDPPVPNAGRGNA